MKQSRFQPTALVGLFLCLPGLMAMTFIGTVEPALAAEDVQATEGAAATKEAGDTADSDPEELLDRIHRLNRKHIEGETREEKITNYCKNQRDIIEVAGKLFAQSLEDEDGGLDYAAVAVQATVGGLRNLQQLGDTNAKTELEAFVKILSVDKRPEVATFGQALAEEIKYEFALDADRKDVERIAAALKKDFAKGDIPPQTAALILQALMRIEQAGHTDLAKNLNLFFAGRFAESDNEQIASYSERLAGTALRLDLPGKPIEVVGDFLGGGKVDWDSYRGKVVLLDYWATWCGPCIEELPNLLKNYETYNDRGFDVIGISVDENREAVEQFLDERKLPWQTIFSDELEEGGWNHPMAKRYGVGSLPIAILVDKQGKVVSLDARGDELNRLLAELLGPPQAGQQSSQKKAG